MLFGCVGVFAILSRRWSFLIGQTGSAFPFRTGKHVLRCVDVKSDGNNTLSYQCSLMVKMKALCTDVSFIAHSVVFK